MSKGNLSYLYLMELCAGAARGSFLVCIGWTTLIISGDVARVGQVFIVAMLTMTLTGPIVGVIVDRYNRKYLAMFAHLGIALSLTLLGLALGDGREPAIFWFFAIVVAVTIFRSLYQSSHDGLIHANVDKSRLVEAVARFRGIHLLATVLGTLLAGLTIEHYSPTAGFVLTALFSVLLVLSVSFVKGIRQRDNTAGFAGFIEDFSGGLALFAQNRMLRILTLLAGVALPIGQLSNAILSSFIHDDLGRGSDVFGLVDASWPLGGMIAAAVMSLGLKKLSATGMEYLLSFMVGISTVVFSFCSTVFSLALVHAAMGFSVWMCRIVIDGRILQICSEHTVGRTRVYIDVMFSFAAMVMCFSPTLVELQLTSHYFLFWGTTVVISTGLLGLTQLRGNRDQHPN
ncbi:MAG: MFS transporter [Gammaproteobacteria bacterium]|nr:MFS transporter [Gammaproteobacteria bacterium]